MPRVRTCLIAHCLGLALAPLHAQTVTLTPFAARDEWTFSQIHEVPGEPTSANEVHLSTLYKLANGDALLAWAEATTNEGKIVWQPVGTLPAGTCAQDFLGRNDFGRSHSCRDGLTVGTAWETVSSDHGATEQVSLVVTGLEPVDVPAGRFNAVKIQGKGWRRSLGKDPERVSVTYWFAPKVKAPARAVRQYRSQEGSLRVTITEELTASKVN